MPAGRHVRRGCGRRELVALAVAYHGQSEKIFARFSASARRLWPVWLTALLVLASGLAAVAVVLLTRLGEAAGALALPAGIDHWSRSLTGALGFALLYVCVKLLQRRRTAWWLGLVFCALSAAAPFGHGGPWYTAALPALALALLIRYRRLFTVKTEPTSIAQGAWFFAASLAFAVAYGTVGFWLLDRRDFGIDFSWHDALVRTLREFFLLGDPELVPRTRQARWFLESLAVIGAASAGFALWSLFRPLSYRLNTLPKERNQAAALLERYGRCSLDYYKLWPDKSFFFSRSGNGFVAYRAAWGVVFSLGDPIAPSEEMEQLTRDFLRFSNDNGWQAAFLQTLPDLVPMYRRLGLNVLKVGENARVNIEHFSAVVAQKGEFKRKLRKLSEQHLAVTRHAPPHPDDLLDEVEEISNEWLSLPGRAERGFSLGSFSRGYVSGTTLFVLRDEAGKGIAFVNQVRSYRSGEAAIDMMRHRQEIPNGAMDFLFARVIEELGAEDYTWFDLGLAALAGVGERPGASIEERAVHELFEHLNRFFSYKGLRRYKSKFEPEWEDSFLVYQGGAPGLVKAAVALTKVAKA